MSMHKIPLTPIEEAGLHAHGLQRHIGKPSQLADVFRQGVAWGQTAERERITTKLYGALTLEGFGCACDPTYQCGTCKARDILDKALGPLLRELRSNAGANSAAEGSPGREATES